MDTASIDAIMNQVLKNSPVSWLGVFPSDLLPLPCAIEKLSPCCYIANTDPKGKEGTHWVAFFHATPTDLDFFDSFGSHPKDFGFHVQKITQLRYNQMQVQSCLSNVCAHYCIFFLIHRSHAVPMEHIIAKFKSFTYARSDSFVDNFIQRIKQDSKNLNE